MKWGSLLRNVPWLIACVAFASGCAHTKVTSFRDPSFQGKTFRKILVVAPFSDMESRTQAEEIFSSQLSKHGVESLTSIGILMPTRQYKSEEILDIRKKKKVIYKHGRKDVLDVAV